MPITLTYHYKYIMSYIFRSSPNYSEYLKRFYEGKGIILHLFDNNPFEGLLLIILIIPYYIYILYNLSIYLHIFYIFNLEFYEGEKFSVAVWEFFF